MGLFVPLPHPPPRVSLSRTDCPAEEPLPSAGLAPGERRPGPRPPRPQLCGASTCTWPAVFLIAPRRKPSGRPFPRNGSPHSSYRLDTHRSPVRASVFRVLASPPPPPSYRWGSFFLPLPPACCGNILFSAETFRSGENSSLPLIPQARAHCTRGCLGFVVFVRLVKGGAGGGEGAAAHRPP